MSLVYSNEREDKSEDSVYRWQGYIGDINLTSFPVFCDKRVEKLAVGGGHSLFLTSDHEVYGQGKNDRCQAGNSDTGDILQEPTKIESLSDKNVIEIACGVSHSGVICENGDVYCWGDNSRKQCGIDIQDTSIAHPTLVSITQTGATCEHGIVGEAEKVVAIKMACGAVHTMILSSEGEVWTWGEGIQLGLGDKIRSPKPCHIETLHGKNVINIYSGHSHSVALVARSTKPLKTQNIETKSGGVVQTQKYYPSRCGDCNTEIYTYTDTSDTCIIDEFHICGDKNPEFDKSIDSMGDSCVSNQLEQTDLKTTDTKTSADEDTNITGETTEIKELKQTNNEKSDLKADVKSEVMPDEASISLSDATKPPDKEATSESEISLLPCTATEPSKQNSSETENTSQVPVTESSTTTKSEGEDNEQSQELNSPDGAPDSVPTEGLNCESDAAQTAAPSNTSQTVLVQKTTKPTDTDSSEEEEDIWQKAPTPESDSKPTVARTLNFSNQEEAIHVVDRQVDASDGEKAEENSSKRSSFGGFLPYSSGFMQNIRSATSKAFTNLQQVADKIMESPGYEALPKSSSQELNQFSASSPSSESVNFPLTCDSFRRGSKSSDASPTKDWSPDKDRVSKKPQSIRTLIAGQEQLSKRTSSTDDSISNTIITDTEVWVWGRNSKGQLGLGDNIDRNNPTCIKMMNGKEIIVMATGHSHCVAATVNSQVYTWGHNGYLQLGHNETTATPCRVKFMKGCYVWDVAAGDTFSLFLADSSGGIKSSVFYCGKHPCKDATVPLKKTMNPIIIGSLKKCGYIRQIQARGDDSFCFVKPGDGVTAAMFEFAASERGFHQHLNRIINAFIKPLQKSAFYTSMDVFPYKSCFQNLLQAFTDLIQKVGEGITELNEAIRENKSYFDISLITNSNSFIKYFKRYSTCYCDMLAVGGFEFCGKAGSSFFDQCRDIFPDLITDKTADKNQYSSAFRRTMEYPLLHVKLDYRRLFGKMSENLPQASEEKTLLSHAIYDWDILKWTMNSDHKIAETTRAFWETAHPKISDCLRIPNRRLLRDSKNNPLMLPNAGRFSSHMIMLFNDGLVHSQNNVFQLYPLTTVWVESHSSETEQQNVIIVSTPEDTLTLVASTPEEKVEWLMALNSAINTEIASVKSVCKKNSVERLTPPLIRHVNHTFTKHCLYKDACYNGFMLNGKMHGQGEMTWNDGRTYIGKFNQGLQQGHGKYSIPKSDGIEIQEGNWTRGQMNGYGTIRYANGDVYKGYFKDGFRFGHGVYNHGLHMSIAASIFIGEWADDKRHGYGVQDDTMKGEKYMGMWQDDCCHGNGVVVTLDGMYFEGNFVFNKLTGFGLMLMDDNSWYEGEFQGVTQLQGKGCLTLPSGDKLEGMFNGSWNEGLKINGTFSKGDLMMTGTKPKPHMLDISNQMYGKLSVPADKKWSDIFKHTLALLGYSESKKNPDKAWEVVAVRLTQGQKVIKELSERSPSKARTLSSSLEGLQTIPPYNNGSLCIESYNMIIHYLAKAFDNQYHPLGNLMDSVVNVFRAAYIGVGAHPRLLYHAVQEIKSYVKRIYFIVRLLFPDLPSKPDPVNIYPESSVNSKGIPTSTESVENFINSQEESCEIISAAGLLYPILLPKIYPPLFDLYALYNDKDDERCWERVTKLNRQGDMALMAYLGIEERFWLMKEILLQDKDHTLSTTRDQCYASAVDTLQQLSTAFSPIDKLRVIEKTFQDITETVQTSLADDHVWCMDDLFPIFQFVVVRAKIRHLGAEVHMIDDLMESHLEFGEFGMMFTTLKACYFQIQTEKLPHH